MTYAIHAPFLLALPGDDAALIVRTPAIAEPYHALLLANQARLSRWEPWAAAPLELTGTRTHLASAAKNWADGKEVPTAIIVRGADGGWVLAGSSGLRIDSYSRTGRIGYWIDGAYEGRGLVTRAARALVEHAFGALSLARIEIGTTIDNIRSQAVAERLGAVREGVLREAVAFPDHRRDAVVYGLLAREWTATGGRA